MKKRIFTLIITLLGVVAGFAQTYSGKIDVTSSYLNSNPSFEDQYFDGANNWTLTGNNVGNVRIRNGGTRNVGRTTYTVANNGITDGTYGRIIYYSGNQARTATLQYKAITLPAGSYHFTIDFDAKTNGGTSTFNISAGNVATGETVTFWNNTQLSANNPQYNTYHLSFTLSEPTTLRLTITINFAGGQNSIMLFDNARLYRLYPSLDGHIKKAKALNTVMNNAGLASAITTAENTVYTTEAQIQAQIDALVAAWEAPLDVTTPKIAINNGTFDATPINFSNTDNPTTYSGTQKDGTKTLNIANWTNVSEGDNARAATALYNLACGNDIGSNSMPSPTTDMFGQTAGGVLHISTAWTNTTRYQQTLPTLPAGRYIFYYEGFNQQNNSAWDGEYFGISNCTKGNIAGSANTFKFADVKVLPINQWTATAMELVLGGPQDGAQINVGVKAKNEGSGATQKWWIDNVELYYLGWDATSALDALQTMINAVAGLNTSPMNKDVCQNMIDKRAIAQDVFNTPAKHTYEQITSATLALQQALDNAEESVAEYVRIKARIDQMNTADQRGGISQANFQTLPFYTKYSDGGIAGFQTGTYVSYDEVMTQYRTSISNWWATRAANNSNLTAFVINQGFEFGTTEGWTYNGGDDSYVKRTNNGTYSMSNTVGDWLFNTWKNGEATLYIEQAMEGLPNGLYTIRAIIGAHAGRDITLKGITGEPSGASYETTTDIAKVGDKTVGQEMVLDNVVVSNGLLTLRFENTDGAETFFKIDNVRIFYKTTVPGTPPAKVTGIMRLAAETEQNDAYAIWDGGNHTSASYARCIVAHSIAQASHEAYLAAQRAVDRVDALLNNTNVYTYDAYVKFYDFYNIYKEPFDDRTLADNLAAQMEYQIFGNRGWRQTGLPVVAFLGSAWDHAGDEMWNDGNNWKEGFNYNKDAAHNYWVNTWSNEGDTDGSNFKEPFMEYWYADNQTLANNTLTAVVKAVPGSNNTVTAWIRARIANGQTLAAPTGITLQVAPENDAGVIDPANIVSVTPTWTRIGTTQFYQAHVTLNNGKADYDSDGDGFGDLRIQFVINNTQASWFSFRDVRVDYGSVTVDWDEVDDEIDFADNNVTLGFWGGEYSPYTNIKALKAVEALRTYKEAHEKGDPVNNVLVNSALYTLNGHPGWVVNPGDDWGGANPQEMNAVSWRTNYTRDEIVHAYDYNDDGSIAYDFRTIIPDGWDLNGRSDGYDTRLMKYGVNTGYPGAAADDVGLFANCDSLAMFTKHDTRYGEQIGYTMPLKKGTKYSLTFTYTNWANEAIHEADQFHDNVTYIVVHKKGDSSAAATCPVYWSDDDNPLEYLSHKEEEDVDYGNAHETRWKAVRAYFTTKGIEGDSGNEDYVIEFNKSIKNRQIQMAVGEVYILKYREKTPGGADFYLDINGQNTNTGTAANNYTDNYKIDTSVKACNAKLTRTIKKGQWNSLCLPIKVPYKDMRRFFQVNGQPAVDKVFIYTGTTRSGIYEVLNFTSRQGGIQAGQPVLVKPNIDGNDDISDDVKIINLEMKNFVVKDYPPVTKDPNKIYDFVGVYEVYNVKQYDIYTKHNATTGEDELIKKVTDDKKTWLQPTRAYFKDVSVESGRYDAPGLVKLWGFNLDDVETGIMAVEPDGTMTVTSGNIYDLNGRMVRQNATNLEGLRPGIYVVDGRKVMVR